MKLHNFKLIAALASILLSPIALKAMQGPNNNSSSAITMREFRQQSPGMYKYRQMTRERRLDREGLSSEQSIQSEDVAPSDNTHSNMTMREYRQQNPGMYKRRQQARERRPARQGLSSEQFIQQTTPDVK